MKILYDHQIFKAQKFGGINRYFKELSSASIQGFETEIIDHELFPVKVQKNDLISKGIRFSKRKMGIGKQSKENGIINRISENNYDIFHPTYYNPYFIEYTNKPFVVSVYDMIHEIFPEYFNLSDNTTLHKKYICEKANAIIAISETTKNDLINIFKIDESKISTILLASDFDKIIPEKPKQFESLENYILFTGQRWIYKNFYFMARVVSKFLLNDKTLKLVCTGSPFTSAEFNFFKELGVENQVIHSYSKTDGELAWLYQNALCFIFPSLYEGFGFPLLEAFASNCPTISSNGGSLREIGGEGVRFFNPKSTKELETAISDVLFNAKTRNNLIEKGQIEFQKYSWDNCRKSTFSLYKSLIKS